MQKLIKNLIRDNNAKIILVVLDGLGGLPVNGKTELETARTPAMDSLARNSACGLHLPVSIGVTPGSGPGHLALFGYDPLEYQIGRGILEALGLGMDVEKTDVAIRCNYATLENGIVTDRRAGRIPSGESRKLTEKLQANISRIDEAEILFAPGMEHRSAVLFRFPEPLAPDASDINDTDPQTEGVAPLKPVPASPAAEQVVRIAEKFIIEVTRVLKDEKKANCMLLRGFSIMPQMTSFGEAYGLNALAVANYPMYRGISKLVGMHAPVVDGDVQDEINFLEKNYNNYDFFFLHVKKPDSYGEDGDFDGKVKRIEEFDLLLPQILKLKPDVLIITGDHSTPSLLKGHSWHPVPVLVNSPYVLGGGLSNAFSEKDCLKGELGIFRTVNLMPLALANAGRLKKFGA
ncbi:MAG: 2,3-bisphosphoglycerate-independent phosphoglycerate mutase [Nitrospirota bacterium]|nr:2,3-bisphosphoglycerate-independent phosphoglycerate mutase [Nitrospirota bacterium]